MHPKLAVGRPIAEHAAERRGPDGRAGVWVPIASGTMKSATAAAEPLEDPAGVRVRSCVLRVGPGCRLANSVVTVLPRRMPPALRDSATHAASRAGPAAPMNGRSPLGRHVKGVDNVLDRRTARR